MKTKHTHTQKAKKEKPTANELKFSNTFCSSKINNFCKYIYIFYYLQLNNPMFRYQNWKKYLIYLLKDINFFKINIHQNLEGEQMQRIIKDFFL